MPKPLQSTMWLVLKTNRLIYLVWYFALILQWFEEATCLNNRVLMASRSTSRALVIPYDIAENLGVENQVKRKKTRNRLIFLYKIFISLDIGL